MVRTGSCLIVFLVTTDAIIAHGGKLQHRRSAVALFTTYRLVNARQRESVLLVQLGDVVYQPIGSGVAARTIGSDAELVHVFVTSVAVGRRFGELQGFVATSAVHIDVLTREGKTGFTVVKTHGIESPNHARGFGDRRLFRIKVLPV